MSMPKPRLGPWPMKTMDLYVARVFFLSWLACAVSFIGLFVVIEAFAKLDRFLKQEGGLLGTVLHYYGAMVPTLYTNYMGPILTSAAALFTVTLLNRHNEVQALKSVGVSVYRILAPIFVFAALLFSMGESGDPLGRLDAAWRVLAAFAAFCLGASAIYLVNDLRDGANRERMAAVAGDAGCHACHTQQGCTEHCPRHLSPTAGIAGLKRAALRALVGGRL